MYYELLGAVASPFALALTGSAFTDVSPGRWSYSYITHLYRHNAITGFDDGRFAPEVMLTTEQFFAMSLRLSGRTNLPGAGTGANWAQGYMQYAISRNWITSSQNRAHPIMRGEAFFLLYNIFTCSNNNVWNNLSHSAPLHTRSLPFSDTATLAAQHQHATLTLYQHGILSGLNLGTGNQLQADRPITREQFAVLLHRIVVPHGVTHLYGIVAIYISVADRFDNLLDGVPRTAVLRQPRQCSFRFTAPRSGIFTFTTTNNTAPIVYTYEHIHRATFTRVVDFPQPAQGQSGAFYVSHAMQRGETVVVAINGQWGTNYSILATGHFVHYIRPVRVAVQSLDSGREFGATRRDGRVHTGIDFVPHRADRDRWVNNNLPLPAVYAVADGYAFLYQLRFYRGTNALFVEKDDGRIVMYGEIAAIPGIANVVTTQDRTGTRVRVTQGQQLGNMKLFDGENRSNLFMLHLEYYSGAASGGFLSNEAPFRYVSAYFPNHRPNRRSDLLNPTHFFHLPNW
jgi:hypothetical protein